MEAELAMASEYCSIVFRVIRMFQPEGTMQMGLLE